MNVNKFFDEIFKKNNWIKKKNGLFYYEKSPEVMYCIEIQKYTFKYEDKKPFTINFSVLCPKISFACWQEEIRIIPASGLIDLRPFEFYKINKVNGKFKEYWLIEDFETEKIQLQQLFDTLVFPFFEKVHNYNDILSIIDDNKIKLFGGQLKQYNFIKNQPSSAKYE